MSEFHNNNDGDGDGHGVSENTRHVNTGAPRHSRQPISAAVTPPDRQSSATEFQAAEFHATDACVHSLAAHAKVFLEESGRLGNDKISPALNRIITHNSPISLCSGEALLQQTDFQLPGPIPLQWSRIYRSSHQQDYGIGVGWSAPYLARLLIQEHKIILVNGEGRLVPFLRPRQAEACCNPVEQLTLFCVHNLRDGKSVFTVEDKNKIYWQFDGPGDCKRLHAISMANGVSIRFLYDEAGRMTRMRDSAGRHLKLEYNITNRLRAVNLVDSSGKILGKPLVQYHFNNEGDLVSVIDAAGNAQHFQYHRHLILKHTNKDGFKRYFHFDRHDIDAKCIHYRSDGNIHERRVNYDEANKITRCSDACGHTTVFHFNESGLLTRKIEPEGGVRDFEYDHYGRLLLERDPMGNSTQYGYNGDSKLIRFVNPSGHTTRFEYDDHGRLTAVTDALGMRWRRRYDLKGRLASVTDPLGYAVQYQYDEHDNPIVITNAMKRNQRLEWDETHQLLAHTDAAGNRRQFRYDALGRLTETQERQRLSRFFYDPMGRVIETIAANGDTERYEYTAEGHLRCVIDGLGRITQYTYDGLPPCIERSNCYGQAFKFGYDKERNLTAMMNENGDRCEFHYDGNQRLSKETGFDRRMQHYGYNAAGHLVSHTDGTTRITQFKRDAMGRIIKKWSSDQDISRYEYDALGRLVHAINKDAELEYKFSDNGQLTEERQNSVRLRHQYDLTNQRTATRISKTEHVDFEYNAQGLLKRVTFNHTPLIGITRNVHGQEIVRTSGAVNSFFAYDALGRICQQRVVKDQTPLMDLQYRYDAAGNLCEVNDQKYGSSVFHYDALNRVQEVQGPITEHFNYDSSDNLLDARQAFAGSRVRHNRIKVFQDYRFEYDDAGNIIREVKGKKQTRYTYNTQNQLVKVEKNGRTVEYGYDPLGRRVKKSAGFGDVTYWWDGSTLLGESCDRVHITYIHEPHSRYPLYQVRNGEVFFYHNDCSGTPLLLTDVKGDIVWQARYKFFGQIISYEKPFVDNAIGFQGFYYDAESGLYCTGFRYYHPVLARFIHQDPRAMVTGDTHLDCLFLPLTSNSRRQPPLAHSRHTLRQPLPLNAAPKILDNDFNFDEDIIRSITGTTG